MIEYLGTPKAFLFFCSQTTELFVWILVSSPLCWRKKGRMLLSPFCVVWYDLKWTLTYELEALGKQLELKSVSSYDAFSQLSSLHLMYFGPTVSVKMFWSLCLVVGIQFSPASFELEQDTPCMQLLHAVLLMVQAAGPVDVFCTQLLGKSLLFCISFNGRSTAKEAADCVLECSSQNFAHSALWSWFPSSFASWWRWRQGGSCLWSARIR